MGGNLRIEQREPPPAQDTPRIWTPCDPSERLKALFGSAYDKKWKTELWRLQVQHHVSDRFRLEPNDIDLWALQDPESGLHVFELGWTLAELTHDPILALFSGKILVHGDNSLKTIIQDALGRGPDDRGLDVAEWPDPRELERGCIVVSAEKDPARIADIRDKADRAKAVLLVWTRSEPRPDKRRLIEIFVSQSSARTLPNDKWVGALLTMLVRDEVLPDEALRRTVMEASPNSHDSSDSRDSSDSSDSSVLRLRNTAEHWHSPFKRTMPDSELPEYVRRYAQELSRGVRGRLAGSPPVRCTILLSLTDDAMTANAIQAAPLDLPNAVLRASAWQREVEHPDPDVAVACQLDKLAGVFGVKKVSEMMQKITQANYYRDLVWVHQEACQIEDVPEVKFAFVEDMPWLSTGAIELFAERLVDALDYRHFVRVGLVVHLVLIEPSRGADGLNERLERWAKGRCTRHIHVATQRVAPPRVAAPVEPPAAAPVEVPASAAAPVEPPAPDEAPASAAPHGDGEGSFWQRLQRRLSTKVKMKMGRP
ncbi:hypothetical protein [Sorangium sp. So ce204]|uniref:hypothetical protein n=1 Tax=Sorangium sp. So ce204 TaxID=3133288 RepID=UPI003F5E244E